MVPSDPLRPTRVRLADVAAAAQVSTASVSLVLSGRPGPSEATRERVTAAAARLGYRPDRAASALARRSSALLGVMIDVRNPFHADLAEALHVYAERAGWDVVLSTLTAHRDEARAMATLVDFRCESLVLLGSLAGRARVLEAAQGRRVVLVGRAVTPRGFDVVRADDELGMSLLVEHLVSQGCRDIVFVDGPRGAIADTRRRGYAAAMTAHGLGSAIRSVAGGDTEEAGISAGRELLGSLPQAVLAFNDRCAVGVLNAFARAGVVVPEEIAVAGYDDSPQARMWRPELTSVSQQVGQLACHAVDLAVAAGGGAGREVVVTPRLVVRSSTRR